MGLQVNIMLSHVDLDLVVVSHHIQHEDLGCQGAARVLLGQTETGDSDREMERDVAQWRV